VLRNLIGNALKYTPSGGVLIALRLRGTASRHWLIDVFDTGIGIAAGEQQRVFEEFYQVGNAERDRSNGLGLGLAIVRRLADLMQVPVRLTSVPNAVRASASRYRPRGRRCSQHASRAVPARSPASSVAGARDDCEVRHSMQTLLPIGAA
jgi:light-regulated signal transduction histidine kinase (bacteriophytochrome)